MVFVMPVGDGQQGHSAAAEGRIRGQYVLNSKLLCARFTLSLLTLYSHSAPALQPLCSHSTVTLPPLYIGSYGERQREQSLIPYYI